MAALIARVLTGSTGSRLSAFQGGKKVFSLVCGAAQSPVSRPTHSPGLLHTSAEAMKKMAPHSSTWAERRSTVVYAIRSATFGSWRMLTLGAEYEDTWAPSPDKKRDPKKRAKDEPVADEEEEAEEACSGESEEPSWKAVHGGPERRFNTILELNEVRKIKDGVRQAVWKHDTLNSNPLTHSKRKGEEERIHHLFIKAAAEMSARSSQSRRDKMTRERQKISNNDLMEKSLKRLEDLS